MKQIYVEKAEEEIYIEDPVGGQKPGIMYKSPRMSTEQFLIIAANKLLKLKNGESDPKIKANLYEIAMRNLKSYKDNGGKPGVRVVVKDKNGNSEVLSRSKMLEMLRPYRPTQSEKTSR